MAEMFGVIRFDVTDGDFKGRYEVSIGDFTAVDMGDAQKALNGQNLEAMLYEAGRDEVPPPLQIFSALVWLQRRRGHAKGLAYKAVAQQISWKNLELIPDDDEVEDEDVPGATNPEA